MMYQHLRRPTAMPYGTTLHIFKKGIKPVWEDPAMENGARFQLKMPKTVALAQHSGTRVLHAAHGNPYH